MLFFGEPVLIWPFSPLTISNEGRVEMMKMAHNKTPDQFVRCIYALRNRGKKRPQPSNPAGWPQTCRTEKGFVLRAQKTNITELRRPATG